MFVSNLKLWNFRKYWLNWDIDLNKPNLDISFNRWMNLFVWPNDSGKTAVIDALKLVLKTCSSEWIRLEQDDFFWETKDLRIEVIISDWYEDEEKSANWAKNFTEWLSFDENKKPQLRLILEAHINELWKILPYDVKAWNDEHWSLLSAEAKDYLKTVYLKPLRDADHELTPKRGSRLSQILAWTPQFNPNVDHQFIEALRKFSEVIEGYFKEWEWADWISKWINELLNDFWKDETYIKPTEKINLKYILELLKLSYDEKKPWLWSQNLLFIATELLYFSLSNDENLKLGLIEEIEAHLHPQKQLKVIETLEEQSNKKWFQLILTTHSPNISSKIDIENLFLFDWNNVFSLRKEETKLEEKDYSFLERFLDVTKANLFFSKWIIFVEWRSEEILMPAIAKQIWLDLTKKEVSIINVWNVWFSHYEKIFQRNDDKLIDVKTSIVTDLDLYENDENWEERDDKITQKRAYETDNSKVFIWKEWTLERCLFKALWEDIFKKYALQIHPKKFNETDRDVWEILKELLKNHKFHKVEFSYILAQEIEEWNVVLNQENDYIKYLIDAIKHACWESIW